MIRLGKFLGGRGIKGSFVLLASFFFSSFSFFLDIALACAIRDSAFGRKGGIALCVEDERGGGGASLGWW